MSSNPRAWMHSAAATIMGLLVAVVFDAAFGFVRLGVSFGTAAWGCALSVVLATGAAMSAAWAVKSSARGGGVALLATASWGLWLAIFCVRSRWGFVSLVRVDAGYGPPLQLAVVLFSLTGLTASWLGRYLLRSRT